MNICQMISTAMNGWPYKAETLANKMGIAGYIVDRAS